MHSSIPLLAAALLVLAGCAGPAASPTTTDGRTGTASTGGTGRGTGTGTGTETSGTTGGPGQPAPPSTSTQLAFAVCRQFHTAYPARADDFAAHVPEGFTVAADATGGTDLYVAATDCASGPAGERAAQLWVTIAVVPPQGLADPDAAHHLALEAYVDSAAALAWLHGAGAHLTRPCACAATEGPAPGLDGFTVDGDGHDYTMQTALAPDGSAFGGGRLWTYVAHEGKATLRLLAESSPSTTRGIGSVVLAYAGDGAAPPVFPGTVAHVIDGLAYTITAEPLAAA